MPKSLKFAILSVWPQSLMGFGLWKYFKLVSRPNIHFLVALTGCLVKRTRWYRNVIHEQEFEPPEALNLEIEPYEFDPYEDELPAAADPEGMRGVNTRYLSTISISSQFLSIATKLHFQRKLFITPVVVRQCASPLFVTSSKYGQFLEIILYDNSVTVPDNKHKLGSILIKLKDDIKIAKTEEDFQTDPERKLRNESFVLTEIKFMPYILFSRLEERKIFRKEYLQEPIR